MGLTFVVEEQAQIGGGATPAQLERFEWDADRQSAPLKPFGRPGEMRHKRSDNGGGVEPTFQILGPKLVPITFQGRWDDRYNRVGFAMDERRRFLGMCYRGRRVRISYGETDLLAHIVSWDTPERDDFRIDYTFTIEPIRDELIFSAKVERSSRTVESPRQLVQSIEDQAAVLAAVQADIPDGIVGSLSTDIQASLALLGDRVAAAKAVVSQRLLVGTESIPALRQVGAIFRDSITVANTILVQLETVRADTDLATRTAAAELAFEEWRRGMAYEARIQALLGIQGERAMGERAEPQALAIYQPRKGETLYEVSLNCYGTPHNAGLIADHNDLHSWTLDGTVALEIPEAPQAG
jgi:hypothetical protein